MTSLFADLPLRTKLILVAAVPGLLATLMFNFSADKDGSAAIALTRFAFTFVVTAINFCVITWDVHRVGELQKHLVVEQILRRKADKRAEEAEGRASKSAEICAKLDERVTVLEADKKCLERLRKAWTPEDDAKLKEILRIEEN